MKSPTDQWEAYLKHGEGLQLTSHCVERTVVQDLVKLGYTVPSKRTLVDTLTAGLEPLSVVASESRGQHGQTTLCSFEHFLNLLWRPLIDFIEACDRGIDPQWTESLGLHEKALLSEMQGVLASAEKALDMDAWVAFIQKTLLRLLQI